MSQLRDRKPPEKIAMRLASLSALERNKMKDYLLLERPTGYLQTVLALASEHSRDRRPQLSQDPLETPGPSTYFTCGRSTSTRGIRIRPLGKYSRDALPDSTQPWTYNAAGHAKKPDPTSYCGHQRPGVNPVRRTSPAYSFPLTPRKALTMPVQGVVPGPNIYNCIQSSDFVKTAFPSYSMSPRFTPGKPPPPTPGPAHYSPAYNAILKRNPSINFPTVHRFNHANTF